MRRVFIGLGSNLGDREALLNQALHVIRSHPHFKNVVVSSLYESQSVGASGPDYLNAAVAFDTSLSADAIHDWIIKTEQSAGRLRTVANAPRTLDLDLLCYGTEIISSPDLIVPHPRLHERAFVLVPLNEIAPDWVHPVYQKSISEMLRALSETNLKDVKKYGRDFLTEKNWIPDQVGNDKELCRDDG